MTPNTRELSLLTSMLALALGCSAAPQHESHGAAGTVAAGGTAGAAGASGGGGGIIAPGGGGSGGKRRGEPPCDNADPVGDLDGDGYSVDAGDCNDCSPAMNPGAYDYEGNGVDEDCNGIADDEPVGCDKSITDLGSVDPEQAASAMGLCRKASGDSWGVVDVAYVLADGTTGVNPIGHGLLSSFGPVQPQEGARMLVLSSGTARAPGDVGYQDPSGAWIGTQSAMPTGYPVPSPSCASAPAEIPNAYDPAGLELTLRAPTNAKSFKVYFNFYTDEFPNFVCKQYNDFFVVLQEPAPSGSLLGNIAFDNQKNPVSVNNLFLEVCEPQTAGGKSFACPQGAAALQNTGFEGEGTSTDPSHAATGWLKTTSPVTPGELIKLRFAIWDAGDFVLASTVLIDRFEWDVEGADQPITQPVPH